MKYYEFFAGGGMAKAGLGDQWECLFANDIDAKKAKSYGLNWSLESFVLKDVAQIEAEELPDYADLAWASFPCQDLSLAGKGTGLQGERSGTFWSFWKLMESLAKQSRTPKIIVLENVYGALTSRNGKDFAAIAEAFSTLGFRFGATVINASKFLPQSRPRLFIIGVAPGVLVPQSLTGSEPTTWIHPSAAEKSFQNLLPHLRKQWLWWKLPEPPQRDISFIDLLENNPQGVEWHTPDETRRLLSMMTEVNLQKVNSAKLSGKREVAGLYRRTRNKVQRAEARFDGLAGCLRTPGGGSSRQTVLIVEGESVRSRLLSTREAARLMGLPDTYQLPERYNEAYHLLGDGLVVPVVRHIAKHILEPLSKFNQAKISTMEVA